MTVIPPEVAQRAKLWLLVIPVLLTHLGVVVLAIADRLVFSTGAASAYPLLDSVVDSHIWIWLNGIAFVAIAAAVASSYRHLVILALSFSSGVLVAWGILAALWGLIAPINVSLLGPLMALIAGIGSRLITFGVAEDLVQPGSREWR